MKYLKLVTTMVFMGMTAASFAAGAEHMDQQQIATLTATKVTQQNPELNVFDTQQAILKQSQSGLKTAKCCDQINGKWYDGHMVGVHGHDFCDADSPLAQKYCH
jgi:hypothetical protein